MQQPQQGISASPHSLNGEQTKSVWGVYFPLWFFKKRWLTKLFKREFLQLMHPLKTPVCFFCAGKRLLPAHCCLAVPQGEASAAELVVMPKSAQGAEISPSPSGSAAFFLFFSFLLRCNHRLVSAPPEQGRCSTQSFSCLQCFFTSSTLFLGNKRKLEAHVLLSLSFLWIQSPEGIKKLHPSGVLSSTGAWECFIPVSGLQDPAHWWEASCAQDLDQDIFKKPLKFPPVAAWSMGTKQLFCITTTWNTSRF